MKPVISQNVVIYYADVTLGSAEEEAICKVIKGSASSIKSLQLQAIFFSFRSNETFQDSTIVVIAHVLLALQQQLDVVVAFCEYNAKQFERLKAIFPNKAIPLFKTISQAMLFLQLKTPPANTPVVLFERDTIAQTLIAQSLEAKGLVVHAVQSVQDFKSKQQEFGNDAFYVYDIQFDLTANHIPVHISQGVVIYSFYEEVDGKLPRFFSTQTYALRLMEGFKVFLFDMSETRSFDPKAVDFFISLTRNAVPYGAVFAFIGLGNSVIDAASEEKIRRAGIYMYPDREMAMQNEQFANLASLQNKKPQKLSKKLVANVLHFVNASLETLRSLTGGNAEKKAHRVAEFKIDNKTDLMGSVISFEGDISGKLVLIFTKAIAQEASEIMLGEMAQDDNELLDVIAEFSNIIAGRSKTLLAERNITISISLPKNYASFRELNELVQGRMGVQIDFLLNGKPLYIFLSY